MISGMGWDLEWNGDGTAMLYSAVSLHWNEVCTGMTMILVYLFCYMGCDMKWDDICVYGLRSVMG